MDQVSVFLILVKSLFCAGSVVLGEATDKAMPHSPKHHCPNLHTQARQPAFGPSTGHQGGCASLGLRSLDAWESCCPGLRGWPGEGLTQEMSGVGALKTGKWKAGRGDCSHSDAWSVSPSYTRGNWVWGKWLAPEQKLVSGKAGWLHGGTSSASSVGPCCPVKIPRGLLVRVRGGPKGGVPGPWAPPSSRAEVFLFIFHMTSVCGFHWGRKRVTQCSQSDFGNH